MAADLGKSASKGLRESILTVVAAAAATGIGVLLEGAVAVDWTPYFPARYAALALLLRFALTAAYDAWKHRNAPVRVDVDVVGSRE